MRKNKIYFLLGLLIYSSLRSYDQSAIDDLNAGETNLSYRDFSDADLSNRTFKNINFTGSIFFRAKISNSIFKNCTVTSANFTDANLSGAKISSSNFKDTDMTNADWSHVSSTNSNLNQALFVNTNMENAHFNNCSSDKTVILKSTISDVNKTKLETDGALISICSFLEDSDIHTRVTAFYNYDDQANESLNRRANKKMLAVAKEKTIHGKLKNNVTKAIFAGDLSDIGDEGEIWYVFTKEFLDPFKARTFSGNNEIPTLTLIGEHERKNGHFFTDFTYTTSQINLLNKTYIKETGETGEDYYKVSDTTSNVDIYMLSECSTRNGYKPINWFLNNVDPTKSSILASHYFPAAGTEYSRWTDGNDPEDPVRTDDDGKAVLDVLKNKLLPYKDNIKLYIGGHVHNLQLKRWYLDTAKTAWIWALNSAARNRFALIHWNSKGQIVCIELYNYRNDADTLRFYPELEDSSDSDDHKKRFCVKYYNEFYDRFPNSTELDNTITSTFTLCDQYKTWIAKAINAELT